MHWCILIDVHHFNKVHLTLTLLNLGLYIAIQYCILHSLNVYIEWVKIVWASNTYNNTALQTQSCNRIRTNKKLNSNTNLTKKNIACGCETVKQMRITYTRVHATCLQAHNLKNKLHDYFCSSDSVRRSVEVRGNGFGFLGTMGGCDDSVADSAFCLFVSPVSVVSLGTLT